MKRVTHAWPALLAMLLCSFLAAPAGADVKSVRSTGSGSVSITIESFSVPNGPNRLGTSALGCNIVVPITTIGRSTEDAMRIRNALANSSAGNPLNGYTFAIAGCSNVVLITHAGTFCLVLPPGPIIEDATCVPDPLPMTGAWGTAFAVFLLLGSGAALLMRRASPARL